MQDNIVKVSLLDFTMNQEQTAVVERRLNDESSLPYFMVKESSGENMIE
jgi:hypothetical protein